MAAKPTTACRILVVCQPDGVSYTPNQVVEFPTAMIAQLKEHGVVDPSKGAVEYCTKELGVVPVVHAAPDDAGQE